MLCYFLYCNSLFHLAAFLTAVTTVVAVAVAVVSPFLERGNNSRVSSVGNDWLERGGGLREYNEAGQQTGNGNLARR